MSTFLPSGVLFCVKNTMKEIKLSQGKVALVDDEDYEELSKYKWCAHKQRNTLYAVRNSRIEEKRERTIPMHRVIMNTPKGMDTDHINHNGLDNRKENLRICTRTENRHNQLVHIDSKSGYKGVSWHKSNKLWRSRISINKKEILIGYFKYKNDAYKAYCEAAKKYHGEFANF